MFSLSIAASKNSTLYLVCIHGLMLVTLLSLIEILWWSLLILVMMLSCSYFYRQVNSVSKLERDVDNNWCCYYKNGNVLENLRLTSCVVTPIFIILYFNGHAIRQHSNIIIADAVDAKLFRQLRVFCRDPKTFQK